MHQHVVPKKSSVPAASTCLSAASCSCEFYQIYYRPAVAYPNIHPISPPGLTKNSECCSVYCNTYALTPSSITSSMNLAGDHHFSKETTEGCCCTTSSLKPSHQISEKKQRMDPAIAEILAGNLNELSMDEREHVFEDIHGCAMKTSKEEPSFVARCLDSLENEIGKIKGTSREAYDLAIRMDQKYVQDRNFRLKFLRADEFVVHNAAKRMVTHFESKLKLFGKEKLVNDITFDDLSCEDQRAVCAGSHQFTGAMDSKGRPIGFIFPELNITASLKSFARARWYQLMVQVEEESPQQSGIVLVNFSTTLRGFKRKSHDANKLALTSLPIRLAAFHVCCINQDTPASFRIMLAVIGKRFQVRTRIHLEESYLATLYTLQSFGINPETVPFGDDGRPQKGPFLELLDSRISFERKSKNDILMDKTSKEDPDKQCLQESIIPKSRDVLLGRTNMSSHLGNVFLEKVIEVQFGRYQQAMTKFEKTCIVMAIMDSIKDSGGRFLSPVKRGREWIVADNKVARESVGARFRYMAKWKI